MISYRANVVGSDGHLLFPQRSKLGTFPIAKRNDEDKCRTYRPESVMAPDTRSSQTRIRSGDFMSAE